MKRKLHRVGDRFGRWVVASDEPHYPKPKRTYWLCRCACGTEDIILYNNLRRGQSKSCGCLAERIKTTHGMTKTPEWDIWSAMRGRCNNPGDKRFADYGGRGIKVDDSWRDFSNFYRDMGPRPTPDHSLDRINNDGNYEPGNVRWATRKEQQRNRAITAVVEWRGETKPVAEWAEILGMEYQTLSCRLRRGWSVERAMSHPVEKKNAGASSADQ
jgi:hypothetical protein